MTETTPETLFPKEADDKPIAIRDNSKRAKIVKIIFMCIIGLNVLGIFSDLMELDLLERIRDGFDYTEEEALASDARQGIIGILQFGLFVTSAVVFLNWFRRAYANLERAGVSINHGESWAVWTWFVPIIVFFRPVQIMMEIWNKTQKKVKEFDATYVLKAGGLIVGVWWTLFIISNFIGRYVFQTAFRQDTLDQIIDSSRAYLMSDIMEIPEALLVIFIVHTVSGFEARLAKEVIQSGGTVIN